MQTFEPCPAMCGEEYQRRMLALGEIYDRSRWILAVEDLELDVAMDPPAHVGGAVADERRSNTVHPVGEGLFADFDHPRSTTELDRPCGDDRQHAVGARGSVERNHVRATELATCFGRVRADDDHRSEHRPQQRVAGAPQHCRRATMAMR